MTMLVLELDPTRVCADDIRHLIDGGEFIHASGMLNAKWTEISALILAQECGVHEVDWNIVRDDTPSTLELTILYFHTDEIYLRHQMEGIWGVEMFDIAALA